MKDGTVEVRRSNLTTEAVNQGSVEGTSSGHDFGWALAALKSGCRVRRRGWNGRGMCLYLVEGSTFEVNRQPLLSMFGPGSRVSYASHIDMWTAQGYAVPWTASQTDILASDWEVA